MKEKAQKQDFMLPLRAGPDRARLAFAKMPVPVVVGLLVMFSAVTFLVTRQKPPVRTALAASVSTARGPLHLPVAVPPKPITLLPTPLATPNTRAKAGGETKADEETAPLTITLMATNGRRHVKVGTGVTLTAFTTVARGQSATLTLFYRLNRGRKTVFSFVQGSLCSATWVAPAPGRYQFTATVLDDRQQIAVSRSVEITVDKPATPSPPRVAAAPPFHAVARRLVYHVVAARFAFSRNAVVLAGALRKSGYRTTIRRIADGRGETTYMVEAGAYRQPGEVFEAVAGLLRSGYPAYFFTGQ